MTSAARCKHLWNVCQRVLDEGIPGDFVECGVWRGGSAGIMGLALKHRKEKRELHLFDSFEGLPEPTSVDGEYAAQYSGGRYSGQLTSVNQCYASTEEVTQFLLDQLRLDPSLVKMHKGWFQNTIPQAVSEIPCISVLRLDGDWYDSTKVCLEYLYPQLSCGGILILDDYNFWEGCAKATDEFRINHSIDSPINVIDRDAVYWVKEQQISA